MTRAGRVIPDGSVVVYREHYRAEWTLRQHVEAVEALNFAHEEPEPDGIWADPEDAQQMLALRRDHGWAAMKAKKAVSSGIDKVTEYLLPAEVDGLPRLYVVETCVNTIREVEGYRWADGSRAKDQPNKPLKKGGPYLRQRAVPPHGA